MDTLQVDSPLTDASQSLSSEVVIEQVPVKCGSVTGVFHLDKFTGRGGQKCVLSESVWCSPIEFESLGGKGKSTNWRKSVLHECSGVPLGTYLYSIGIVTSKSGTASPTEHSPSRLATCQSSYCTDPLLAFVKAYRLKGDLVGLKQEVFSHFDPTSLYASQKLMWESCGVDLERLGLPFHSRRGSDKCQVSDVLLADIVAPVDKLDSIDKIPAIYCEATDLIKLSSLSLDPVSKKLDENSTTLQSLARVVEDLPMQVTMTVTAPVTKCYSELEKQISSVKEQLTRFSDSVTALSCMHSDCPSTLSTAADDNAQPELGNHIVASSSSTHKQSVSTQDCSRNVILFGLPESSLLDAKTAIDNVFTYLISKNVKIVDTFRLGRRSESTSARPRPLLIKLDNYWNRRLLLSSSRKLKEYTVSKLFLREDLPPEARTLRSTGHSRKALVDTIPVSTPSDPPQQPLSDSDTVAGRSTQYIAARDDTDKSAQPT